MKVTFEVSAACSGNKFLMGIAGLDDTSSTLYEVFVGCTFFGVRRKFLFSPRNLKTSLQRTTIDREHLLEFLGH